MPSCHPSVRYPKLYLEPVTALAAISPTGAILRGPNVPAGRTSAAQIRGLGHHRRCVRASERGTTRITVAATAEASLPLSGRDRPQAAGRSITTNNQPRQSGADIVAIA